LAKLWYVAPVSLRRLVLRGRMLIVLAVAWVVLFVIAGAAFNSTHSHATTADNVAWGIVWIALLLLVVLGVVALVALVQSRRSRAR
jgi:hypothetical protein